MQTRGCRPRRRTWRRACRAVATATLITLVAGAGAVAGPAGATPVPAGARPAAAPADAPKATFGIGPSDGRRIDGRSGLSFLASPGSRLVDRVAVVNLASAPATLRVYAADAATSADGSIGYEPRAAARTGAASWITPQAPVRDGVVTLAARQTVIVPLVIRVPAEATPGDHVAGVLASVTSKVRNAKGQLIDFDQRVAVRASFRISGAVKAQLSVTSLRAEYHDSLNPVGSGSATVSYTVRNTGNVTLGARQRVTVSGLFGEDDARAVATLPALLPAASVRMSVTVPDVLPQVRLTARVVLFPLSLPGQTSPGLAGRVAADAGFWGVPWALLVLVLLVVAAVVVVRRRAARAVPRGRHGHDRRTTGAGSTRRSAAAGSR